MKSKSEYIATYMLRSKKLKESKLEYGLQWLNLYAEVEEAAEKSYNKYIKQHERTRKQHGK
jgi:hypothetical protein